MPTMTKSERSAAGDNQLPVLAAEIRKAHADVQDAAKTAAERAIEAGNALIEAKALVKHGEWLPWLREHCALPERTAQVYMKIAGLGLKSATVAVLGLNAAAKTIMLQYPDPFAGDSEEILTEWNLYALYLMRSGVRNEHAGHSCEWLRRNGWNSPSEWFSDDGDRYRKGFGMRTMPEEVKTEWAAFLAENRSRSTEHIGEEVIRITEAEPPEPPPKPIRKRRRRAG